MRVTRITVAMATVALLALAGCGSDTPSTTAVTDSSTTTGATTTVAPPTAVETSTTTTTTTAATTTTVPTAPTQLALWPAADTVFTTPEAAATDFVDRVLGVPPALGAFEAGDTRSGEIAVLSVGENGSSSIERSRLLVRQLGPHDGWFVIAAVHEASTVTDPAAGSTVAPGPVTVAGVGHGFEASMMVSAYAAGDPTPIDAEHTMAGSMEEPGTYSVTLDLTAVAPGTTVMLIVRGGTGLETDPGEFGAIAVIVGQPG